MRCNGSPPCNACEEVVARNRASVSEPVTPVTPVTLVGSERNFNNTARRLVSFVTGQIGEPVTPVTNAPMTTTSHLITRFGATPSYAHDIVGRGE